MQSRSNINFHQTFKPESQYISEILSLADNCDDMSVRDISKVTGIPTGESSGKVEPHITYAKYMGLIEYSKDKNLYTIKSTSLGKIIKDEDRGFIETLTLLVCHCMIVRKEKGAELWSFIIKKILPQYKYSISSELLDMELGREYDMNIKKAPFNSSYQDLFSELNLVSIVNDNIKINNHKFNKEYIFAYAFTLFEYWDELYEEQEEISSNQLDELRFRAVFGWSQKDEYNALECMSDYGIIRMNRQLMPYTILKLVDKDYIIQRLYSELC